MAKVRIKKEYFDSEKKTLREMIDKLANGTEGRGRQEVP